MPGRPLRARQVARRSWRGAVADLARSVVAVPAQAAGASGFPAGLGHECDGLKALGSAPGVVAGVERAKF